MELPEDPRQQSLDNVTSFSEEDAPSNEAYTVNAFAKMNVFRKRGQLCDVVIKVGGREFLAHRVVLAATSDYFDAMFSNGMAESAQLEVELKSISPDIMDALLDYVYTGQVHVTMDNVQDLLPAASLVQMEGVKTACSNFLLAEVDSSNVLGIRRFAELHNCSELEKFARNFAAHNFEVVVEFEEFLCLNHEELLDLVSREDLHIDCEESVYKAVMRWVYHQVPERSPHLPTLLAHIRLPVMSVRFLTDIVDKDGLIRQSLECRDLVDDAKRYHLRPDLRHQMCERRYRQRDSGDEYLVVIGGFGSDQNPSDSVEMFNPRTAEWCELPDLPISYRYVAACSLDTCVYVIGGFDGRERLNTVCLLDIAQREEGWRWLTPMHFKRGLSAACTHKGLIYVCGGFDGQSRLRSLEVYHPKIDEWRILEDMNTAREGAGLVVADNSLYCLGGYNGFHLLNSMEAFDLTRGTWTMCKPMYMCRSGAGCALLGDTIYVCGGYGGAEGRVPLHLDTVEAYNTRLQQWTLVSSMNVPRCYVGACPLAGKIYVAAGYNGSTLLDTVESYDPVENQWWLHDDSRMNHERCDTGMCVVRFLSCTESPAPPASNPGPISHTVPTSTVAHSTNSAAASASTGQLLSIRPPLESLNARNSAVPGLMSRPEPSTSSVWSGSYPNRSHAPGMHPLSSHTALRTGPNASTSLGGAFSSATQLYLRGSSLFRRPHSLNRLRPILYEDTPPGSRRGLDLLSRSSPGLPWSTRQLLTVSGINQVILNRWMAHYPGPDTTNILSGDVLESDMPSSLHTAHTFGDNMDNPTVHVDAASNTVEHGTSDPFFGDPLVPTGQFSDDILPGVAHSTEEHLPHIIDPTTIPTSQPADATSSRGSGSNSPAMFPRLHHSAPESNLSQSIYTDIFSSTDQLHAGGGLPRRIPWLFDERSDAFTGTYPLFAQPRRECRGSEEDQRAFHSPASPGSLSRLGMLRCLSLNEDEDEVDAVSDGSVGNDAAACTPTDAGMVPRSNSSPAQSQGSMQSASSEPMQTTPCQTWSSPSTVCEWPPRPPTPSGSLRQSQSDVLPRKCSAEESHSLIPTHPGLEASASTNRSQALSCGDMNHPSDRETLNQPSLTSATTRQHVDSVFPPHAYDAVREVQQTSDGHFSSTNPVSSTEPPDQEHSRSDGEGEEADDPNPAGVRDPVIGQLDEDDL